MHLTLTPAQAARIAQMGSAMNGKGLSRDGGRSPLSLTATRRSAAGGSLRYDVVVRELPHSAIASSQHAPPAYSVEAQER